MVRKGCLLAAVMVGVAAWPGWCQAGCGCGGSLYGTFNGAAVGAIPLGCPYPSWWYNAGGPCLHIGTYGCAPPSNYHPIVWAQSPEASAAMVRQQLAQLNIVPPPVMYPAPAATGKKVEKGKSEELPPPEKVKDKE